MLINLILGFGSAALVALDHPNLATVLSLALAYRLHQGDS